MITKVDYLKHLGVDVVWLSPIFKSPQVSSTSDRIAKTKAVGGHGL